jgi:hypothetical protein
LIILIVLSIVYLYKSKDSNVVELPIDYVPETLV